MKKIMYLLSGVILFSLASCMDIDNWDAPDAQIHGRIIDSYTGENLLVSQNDWKIRIWERSFTENTPNQQELAIKQDGTYNNSKLFAGTYDMLPYNGPFWPITDTIKNVVLKKSTEQNFTVTPYLQIIDFEAQLGEAVYGELMRPALTLYFRMKAPLLEKNGTKLPNIREIQAFLSLTTFCGASSYIDITEYNSTDSDEKRGTRGKISLNQSWANACKSFDNTWVASAMSPLIKLGPLPGNSGYTYHVRVGVSCEVGGNKHNYSPIVKIVVP